MTVRVKNVPSIVRRINNLLRSNSTWSDLYTATDTVINTVITEPRRQLQTVRDTRLYHRGDWIDSGNGTRAIINYIKINDDDSATVYAQVGEGKNVVEIELPSNMKERTILINNTIRKGFNYYSDTLTTDDYARINDWIDYYWPQSGTQNYANFIGFIKSMLLNSDVLWTSDEGDLNSNPLDPGVIVNGVNTVETADEYPFLEANDWLYGPMDPTWVGGHDWPTSHIQLRYDPVEFANISNIDLFYLFYLLAPIQLVLERIVYDIETNASNLITVVSGSMEVFDSGLWQPNYTQSNINLFFPLPLGFMFSIGFNDPLNINIPFSYYDYVLDIYDPSGVLVVEATTANNRLYFTGNYLVCYVPLFVYTPSDVTYTWKMTRTVFSWFTDSTNYTKNFSGSLIGTPNVVTTSQG